MRLKPNLTVFGLVASLSIVTFGAKASPIDIRVTGTITPGACVPGIENGGIFDYGVIDAEQTNQTSFTLLPEKELTFSLNCTAPTKVALSVADNRATSKLSALANVLNTSPPYLYGLGTASGTQIGSYVLRVKDGSATIDGNEAFGISSNSQGNTWSVPTGENLLAGTNFWRSWSDTVGGLPVEITTLSGKIAVEAALNTGSALGLTDDAELDGSATFTMIYL